MKSVSAAFKTAWAQKYGRKEILKVLYKRRYCTGAAFAYESDWTTMDQGTIPPFRKINWELDAQNLNENLASNVTLSFDDRDRRWLPTGAIFQADATAVYGYVQPLMKFQVQFGYVLADGTKEYTALFTGLAEDFRYDGGDHTVEVTISGNERWLKDADAESVSDAVTSETCTPAADGNITEFSTASVGVGRIDTVVVNGVTQTEGTHYTLSNLNGIGAAKVIFKSTAIPAAGKTPVISGRKWKAAQNIETLIGLLCDQAGVTAGVRSISPVLYPGGVSGSKTIDTVTDWQAGTLTNVDAASVPGSLRNRWVKMDDFTAGLSKWTIIYGLTEAISGGVWHWTALTDHINNFGYSQIPSSIEFGSWDFSMQHAGADGCVYGVFPVVNSVGDGYGFAWRLDTNQAGIARLGGGTNWSFVGTPFSLSGTTLKQIRFTRNSSGYMEAYVGGALSDTATLNVNATGVESSRFFASVSPSLTYVLDMKFGPIYCSQDIVPSDAVSISTMVWESAEQDIGSTPTAWGTLDRTETLNGGTIAYYTKSATTSGGTFDAYTAIDGAGVIQSALRRYFKIKVVFTQSTDYLDSPQVDKLVANFASSSIVLAIADFSGKTVYNAIQRLAQAADYEWGFDGEGLFFFRSKTVSGAAVLELNQENAISRLTSWKPGHDKVINRGRVRYGDAVGEVYVKEYGSTEAGESSPTSEQLYGVRLREEDWSDLYLANDSNLGSARARLLHDNGYLPRITFQLSCRGIPHLDLSDIISVTYADRPRDVAPMFGDPLQVWGDSAFGPSGLLLANAMDVKVLGCSFSAPQTEGAGFTTDLKVSEVL